MNNPNLSLRHISRFTDSGAEERLDFDDGLNVLVGIPNTGKSRWLEMISFLLGETDSAQNVFGAELAEKYSNLSGVIRIGTEEIQLERRWRPLGQAGSVLVNGQKFTTEQFSYYMLERLGLPVVHIPKGNPWGPNRWPVLSWRSLFRHIYRHWRYWTDLADRQPERDQLACLLMFLGVVELVFSNDYDQIIQKNKEKLRLEAAKDEFTNVFTTLYKEIVEDGQSVVSPSPAIIDESANELRDQICELTIRRESLLQSIIDDSTSAPSSQYLSSLLSSWDEIQSKREQVHSLVTAADRRLEDLLDYRSSLESSLRKLTRTSSAASVLSDIKVTVCPVCDQAVGQNSHVDEECFLCHQPILDVHAGPPAPSARLQFEIDQVSSELEESESLVLTVTTERDSLRQDLQLIMEQLREVERQMEPARRAAANITPPELRELDFQIGRLYQQLQTLATLEKLLIKRDDHTEAIDRLAGEIEILEGERAVRDSQINLEYGSQVLSHAMNRYLTSLNRQVNSSWTQETVIARVKEGSFSFKVGERSWRSHLGGTLTQYFLLSYHYALLSISRDEDFRYPGFAMIDFPAAIEGVESIADKENFVLNPFVDLFNERRMDGCQAIVAGAAFEGLKGARRIQLTHVWT